MSDTWYEVVLGPDLEQGDILLDLPVPRVTSAASGDLQPGKPLQVEVHETSSIVLTQSCDLAHDKVNEVLLANVVSYDEFVRQARQQGNSYYESTKFRDALRQGFMPAYALLHEHRDQPVLQWSMVDFRRLHVAPKERCRNHAKALGARLRLRSPYREHVSQSYARYMMRVGLPLAADEFSKYKPSS